MLCGFVHGCILHMCHALFLSAPRVSDKRRVSSYSRRRFNAKDVCTVPEQRHPNENALLVMQSHRLDERSKPWFSSRVTLDVYLSK